MWGTALLCSGAWLPSLRIIIIYLPSIEPIPSNTDKLLVVAATKQMAGYGDLLALLVVCCRLVALDGTASPAHWSSAERRRRRHRHPTEQTVVAAATAAAARS